MLRIRIRIHRIPMFLGRLTLLSLSHNLLDSLAQLAVSSSPLLQVRISVADLDPDPPDPHVLGRLTLLSLSHNLLDSLAQLAVSSSPPLQVRISVYGSASGSTGSPCFWAA